MEFLEESKNIWTTLELIEQSTEYLKSKGFESPQLIVELLLAYVLKCERIALYTNFDNPLSLNEIKNFKLLLKRVLLNEPLQYIIGEAEFMGFKFLVNKNVFIPRPETEILVDLVIKHVKENNYIENIMDIGTGSGCIAISLAKYLPAIKITALDISSDALEVARYNSKKHNVEDRIEFVEDNILNLKNKLNNDFYDVIVSNPPYISENELMTLPEVIKNFEPQIAYLAYDNGLAFYKAIAKIGTKLIKNNGWIFMEMGYDMSENVGTIFQDVGFSGIEFIKDYNGIKRVIKAQRAIFCVH